jgi:hypothetical protein
MSKHKSADDKLHNSKSIQPKQVSLQQNIKVRNNKQPIPPVGTNAKNQYH